MSNKRNPRLKKSNQIIGYDEFQLSELIKCENDPIYFICNYIYIKHPARGRIKFNMYPYQKDMIRAYMNNQFSITLASRQVGKTETTSAFLLWYAIFKEEKTVLIASNKSTNAMEIISKIQYAYEELPEWLKPGIDENSWNKHECKFDNKSRIVATTTSKDSGRGLSISLVYCDEFAFVKPHIQREFWDSILPTLSTGGSMIISSTPNGDSNLFAELWRGAQSGKNEFAKGVVFVPWNAPPGRDEEFKKKFISLLGERKWLQEYECVFLSQELTLFDTFIISQRQKELLEATEPLVKFDLSNGKFKFFKKLVPGAIYLVGVDPSSGSGKDNGVIQVFEFPSMTQVLEYTSNILLPHVFYSELKSLLKFLTNFSQEVYFSVERNGVGQGILAAYYADQDPSDAVLMSESVDKIGFYTTDKSKTKACLAFKQVFESNSMTIYSNELFTEMKSFARYAGSYAAQVGATDDRIMAVVIIFYMIEALSKTNPEAFDLIYTVAAEIESRHSFAVEKEEIERERETYVQKDFDPFENPVASSFTMG